MDTINREHPEYTAQKAVWKQYQDLYAGGEQFRANAGDYLIRRHKEPRDVYDERLSRVFYENYVGSIVDWFAATLLRREAALQFDGSDTAARNFFSVFAEDCDLKGTTFSQFFRQRFIDALVCGKAFLAVEFPRARGTVLTRAHEDAQGRSRAYLVDYAADEVINWNYDDTGSMDWAVVRRRCLQQSKVTDAKWERETRWIHYDRASFRMYRQPAESKSVELVDEGPHALAR